MEKQLKPKGWFWYEDNPPRDHTTIAEGFGLTLETWTEMLPSIHEQILSVEVPTNTRWQATYIGKKVFDTLLEAHRVASAERFWMVEAMDYIVKEAFSSQPPQKNPTDGYNDFGAQEEEVNSETAIEGDVADEEEPFFVGQPRVVQFTPSETYSSSWFNASSPEETTPTHTSQRSAAPTPSSSGETATSSTLSMSPLLPTSDVPRSAARAMRYIRTAIANAPRREVGSEVTTKDPVNNPLNLHFSLQNEGSGVEDLLGVFSTRFLCLPISSPPKVSLGLLKELARQLVLQEITPEGLKAGFFLEEWSYHDLAIKDEVTLNTAIYEILDQGLTRASLRMRFLPAVNEFVNEETHD